ncbi:hypothetical protein [Pseudonocardia nigra]|nr:hypothetical protein [Pseudonocardia nigra]
MRDQHVQLPLAGIGLPDVATGDTVHLGALAGVWVLTLIRHRF